jgi:hypothetical protein
MSENRIAARCARIREWNHCGLLNAVKRWAGRKAHFLCAAVNGRQAYMKKEPVSS